MVMYPATRACDTSVDGRGDASSELDDWSCAPWSERAGAWRDDVVLELWVDVERNPILVRLAGTLNQATAGNLVPVVDELIAGGGRSFELDIRQLHVSDTGGADALLNVQRHVHRSGGRFSWSDDRPAVAPPMPTVGHYSPL